MRAYVELPPEWGPGQAIITAWTKAGYQVEERRGMATGVRYMLVRSAVPAYPPIAANRRSVAALSAHIPRICPYGHELAPGRVLVGWWPCMCPPAWERHGGHRTYSCESCDLEHRTVICYIPEHLPAAAAASRKPDGHVAGP